MSGNIFVEPKRGFNFDLCKRNASLVNNQITLPKFTKTGTTIAGIIFKDGIILGADTRATEGPIVADKNCKKIHYIAPNIYCCGAGTAADTENVTSMISSQIELHSLNSGKESLVATAMTLLKRFLFKYQGHIGAALVLGGVDINGPSLYTVYPHGSTDKLPFVTMGSGSLAAMAVFESGWKKEMNEEEGKELVKNSILAGIYNDLGSGSNVDLCIITKGRVEMLRGYVKPLHRPTREMIHSYKPGSTIILNETIKKIPKKNKDTVNNPADVAMEL